MEFGPLQIEGATPKDTEALKLFQAEIVTLLDLDYSADVQLLIGEDQPQLTGDSKQVYNPAQKVYYVKVDGIFQRHLDSETVKRIWAGAERLAIQTRRTRRPMDLRPRWSQG